MLVDNKTATLESELGDIRLEFHRDNVIEIEVPFTTINRVDYRIVGSFSLVMHREEWVLHCFIYRTWERADGVQVNSRYDTATQAAREHATTILKRVLNDYVERNYREVIAGHNHRVEGEIQRAHDRLDEYQRRVDAVRNRLEQLTERFRTHHVLTDEDRKLLNHAARADFLKLEYED